MAILLAASIMMAPISSAEMQVGQAAYYSADFDAGGWDAIIDARRQWGQLPDGFERSPDGYYCAHPTLAFGTHVRVINAITGEEVVCVVADRVAAKDRKHWEASVVIELSYRAFVDAGGREFNHFVIVTEGGE